MAISCDCPQNIKQYGYFLVEEDVFRAITENEAQALSQERLVTIEVCPRCGRFTGGLDTGLVSFFSTPPLLLPRIFRHGKAPDARDIRRLPGTTLQNEELSFTKITCVIR